jgi:perosamine synthetase
MDEVLRLSEKFGLAVIEDAAEAHGAEHRGRRCGSFGTISCFSFYANKIITTGEGGMLLTDDPDIAKKARELRNLCFVPEQRFLHRELGHNFRLTNLQSAIGVAQLERIEAFLQRKREMAARYSSRLSNSEKLQLPVERPGVKNVYWMFGIVLKESALFDATRFAGVLASRGIETRPFFLGMHEQPALHDLEGLRFEKHPVSEWLSRYGLYLPSGNALTDDQIDYVCDVVLDELK